MCGNYDNYYSRGSYDRLLQDGRYDGDGPGGQKAYDSLPYGSRGQDYGDASGPHYRREHGNYDRRGNYNYYQQSLGYRGAETPYQTAQSYARDMMRPCPAPASPKALSKAAGKA